MLIHVLYLLNEFRLRLLSDAGLVHKVKTTCMRIAGCCLVVCGLDRLGVFCTCQGFLSDIFYELMFVLYLTPCSCLKIE